MSQRLVLRIPGLAGSVTDKGYDKWFDVFSSSFEANVAALVGGSGHEPGKPVLSEFSFALPFTPSSNEVLFTLLQTKALPDPLVFVALAPQGDRSIEVYRMVLRLPLLTHFSIQDSEASGPPVISLKASYLTLLFGTRVHAPDGSVRSARTVTYDLMRAKVEVTNGYPGVV